MTSTALTLAWASCRTRCMTRSEPVRLTSTLTPAYLASNLRATSSATEVSTDVYQTTAPSLRAASIRVWETPLAAAWALAAGGVCVVAAGVAPAQPATNTHSTTPRQTRRTHCALLVDMSVGDIDNLPRDLVVPIAMERASGICRRVQAE